MRKKDNRISLVIAVTGFVVALIMPMLPISCREGADKEKAEWFISSDESAETEKTESTTVNCGVSIGWFDLTQL